MIGPRASILVLLFAAVPQALAQEAQWLQNFEEAKTKAKADGKDLLVDFTGSDWCSWCVRLDKEVFAEAAFQTEVVKHFVLVKLDFPQNESLVTPAIREQNAKLQVEYAVQGYPTVLLLDAAGRPYAQTGYKAGGAAAYVEHLAELQKRRTARDDHFAKAEGAQGIDRARLLASGLEGMVAAAVDEARSGALADSGSADVANDAARQARQVAEATVVRHYRAMVDEIVQLDAKNEAGLQDKYSDLIANTEIDTKTLELAKVKKWDELETLMKDMLARYKGRKAVEQKATFYLAVAAIESRMDFEKGLELIVQAQAIDPDSDFSRHLEGVRKNVERIQQQHGGGRKPGDGKPGDKGEDKKDGGN